MTTGTTETIETAAPRPAAGTLLTKKARRVLLGGAVIAAVAASLFTYVWLQGDRETTDNAQVEAQLVPLLSRVSGPVQEMRAQDNALVHKGDIIAIVDHTEYEAKVQQLLAERDAAKAGVASADAQERIVQHTSRGNFSVAKAQLLVSADTERSAMAQIDVAQSMVTKATTEFQNAETNLNRARSLHKERVISNAEFENAQNAYAMAKASLLQARAGAQAAREQARATSSRIAEAQGHLDQSASVSEQIAVAQANANAARSRLKSIEASLLAAQNQLEACEIRAPVDGFLSRIAAHEGQVIQPGQTMAVVVPAEVYLMANFKEIQVGHIKPGQKTKIEVDAFPGQSFDGVVESIAAATGSKFSLLPPDPASGNYVKVVQRIPIKIKFKSLSPDVRLQAGLSAKVTVFTR